MKTLILYATKYGATYEIAKRISKNIPNAKVHDLGRVYTKRNPSTIKPNKTNPMYS